MTQRKSLARKLIVLFIVLVILIPCSVLVYDTVVSSNEERVDFYYKSSIEFPVGLKSSYDD